MQKFLSVLSLITLYLPNNLKLNLNEGKKKRYIFTGLVKVDNVLRKDLLLVFFLRENQIQFLFSSICVNQASQVNPAQHQQEWQKVSRSPVCETGRATRNIMRMDRSR